MSIERLLPAGEDPLLLSSILVDPLQRRLLAALQEGPTPLTERDLAVHLAALEGDKSPSEVTEKERQQLRVALHHRYLPKLERAGLIERQPYGIVVTDQLSLEDTEWPHPHRDQPDIPSWEVLGTLLARPRRQLIVSILADHRHPLALEDLASALAQEQRSRTTDSSGDVPGLQAMLHHVDLPKLEDVGLIEYDSEKKTITGEPSLTSFRGQTDSGTTETDTDS